MVFARLTRSRCVKRQAKRLFHKAKRHDVYRSVYINLHIYSLFFFKFSILKYFLSYIRRVDYNTFKVNRDLTEKVLFFRNWQKCFCVKGEMTNMEFANCDFKQPLEKPLNVITVLSYTNQFSSRCYEVLNKPIRHTRTSMLLPQGADKSIRRSLCIQRTNVSNM